MPWCASYLRSKTFRGGVFHSLSIVPPNQPYTNHIWLQFGQIFGPKRPIFKAFRDAKAYKGWPGLILNSSNHHGPTPWGGGGAMPLFSTMVATQISSLMHLWKSYLPMAFVVGATREHRIAQVVLQGSTVYYKYTAVYCEYAAVYL